MSYFQQLVECAKNLQKVDQIIDVLMWEIWRVWYDQTQDEFEKISDNLEMNLGALSQRIPL